MMNRTLCWAATVAVSLLVVPARGVTLRIGDPAPKLEVTKWVKGSPVDLAKAKRKNSI